MLSSPLQQAESDRHSETADIETALSVSCSQSDNTENFPRRRSFVDKARNFWQRYGTFFQDTVVQITYFVPEVVVAMELFNLRVLDAKACPVQNENAIKGTAIEYSSTQTSRNFAVFDNQFFLDACKPKWPMLFSRFLTFFFISKRQAKGLEGPIYSHQDMFTFRRTQQGLRPSIADDRHAACVDLRHQHSTPHYSAPHPQSSGDEISMSGFMSV